MLGIRSISWLLTLVFFFPLVEFYVSGLSGTSLRRSRLKGWLGGPTLGQVEERRNFDHRSLQVSVRVEHGESSDVSSFTTFLLPGGGSSENGGVNESLWPSAVAGSVVLQSPIFRGALAGRDILELGSGLGLTGLVAATTPARSVVLSDKEQGTIRSLEETIERNKDQLVFCKAVSSCRLEWRDTITDPRQVDCILGTDLAYYHYLVQPLVDTARAHMKPTGGLTCIIGQANRGCQWDLYKKMKEGGHNQLTDLDDPAWSGETKMVLYELHIGSWGEDTGAGRDRDDTVQVLPIAMLLHSTEHGVLSSFLTDDDYIADDADMEKIAVSF